MKNTQFHVTNVHCLHFLKFLKFLIRYFSRTATAENISNMPATIAASNEDADNSKRKIWKVILTCTIFLNQIYFLINTTITICKIKPISMNNKKSFLKTNFILYIVKYSKFKKSIIIKTFWQISSHSAKNQNMPSFIRPA